MNNKELYKELNFPEGLVAQLNDYENHRSKVISSELKEGLNQMAQTAPFDLT